MAQENIELKGTILDSQTNEPLIGVSIIEKGTSNGTVTDLDGNFSINTSKGSILVISYVGYKSQEIPAKESPITILLEDKAEKET